MRRICVVFITILLISCVDDASEIGADFFNDGALDIAMIDSVTVSLSTVQLEPLATNNASRVVLGSHLDEKLGRISAITFFQGVLNGEVNFKEEPYEYSHATLVLYYDGYSYYDTTQVLKLNAFRVTENIVRDDDNALNNNDRFSIDDVLLGNVTVLPKPHQSDSLEIPLADWFGEELFNKARHGDEDLQTNVEFLKYLKGLCIMPDTISSGPLIGFTNPELRLYYTDKGPVPSVLRYVSIKANSGYAFTNFNCNRENTALVDLPDEKGRLSAALTGGEAYVQGGGGLAARVDLPYLRSLTQHENFFVTTAILELFVTRKSYDAQKDIPAALLAYPVDKRNALISNGAYTCNLEKDTDLERNTHYEIDVTDFVKMQMSIASFNENALLLIPSGDDYTAGVGRIYFATPNSEYYTRLKIYYATINR